MSQDLNDHINIQQRIADALSKTALRTNDDSRSVSFSDSDLKHQHENASLRTWLTRFDFLFKLIVGVRLISSMLANIQDADEVFNSWEPLHYLEHGFGLQSSLYRPKSAVGSWGYILLHQTLTSSIGSLLSLQKIQVFYFLRGIQAVTSAFIEAFFCDRIFKHVHPMIALFTTLFLTFSPGMFISANAFTPASFSMYFITYVTALQLDPNASSKKESLMVSLLVIFIAGVWGLPLASLFALSLVLENMLFLNRPHSDRTMREFARIGLTCFGIVAVPMVLLDYLFYGRWTFSPANYITSLLSTSSTRTWYFYFQVGIKDMNVVFVLALLSLPLLGLLFSTSKPTPQQKRLLLFLAPVYAWLVLLTFLPGEKKESFMYVIYPLLCFNASVALFCLVERISNSLRRLIPSHQDALSTLISYSVMGVLFLSYMTLSLSRIIGLHVYHHAPLSLYSELWSLQDYEHDGYNQIRLPTPNRFKREVTVCVGPEDWTRFPSHYFLPPGYRIGFLSGKGVALSDTRVPTFFPESDDDHNLVDVMFGRFIGRMEPTDYAAKQRQRKRWTHHTGSSDNPSVCVGHCDYLVTELERSTVSRMKRYRQSRDWTAFDAKWNLVTCTPMLDEKKTNSSFLKSFYVPGQDVVWSEYCLLTKATLRPKTV